jgi:cytochrome P450
MRLASEDFEYKGYRINKGDRLLLSPLSANLDESFFQNAGAFDIKRDNAKRHLSFGKGRHYCLGAALARVELEVSFEQIFRRFPNFRINTDSVVYGPAFFMNKHLSGSLPIVLDSA